MSLLTSISKRFSAGMPRDVKIKQREKSCASTSVGLQRTYVRFHRLLCRLFEKIIIICSWSIKCQGKKCQSVFSKAQDDILTRLVLSAWSPGKILAICVSRNWMKNMGIQ